MSNFTPATILDRMNKDYSVVCDLMSMNLNETFGKKGEKLYEEKRNWEEDIGEFLNENEVHLFYHIMVSKGPDALIKTKERTEKLLLKLEQELQKTQIQIGYAQKLLDLVDGVVPKIKTPKKKRKSSEISPFKSPSTKSPPSNRFKESVIEIISVDSPPQQKYQQAPQYQPPPTYSHQPHQHHHPQPYQLQQPLYQPPTQTHQPYPHQHNQLQLHQPKLMPYPPPSHQPHQQSQPTPQPYQPTSLLQLQPNQQSYVDVARSSQNSKLKSSRFSISDMSFEEPQDRQENRNLMNDFKNG
ncbi:hypothetical protein AKO1_006748 [Acrasis kona]|uniref:Uncharacterized protein n=1 Tax=Acrasis kona TaxID=1008807 RepID=A0AAW2ZGP1_9EUKA